MEKLAAQVNGSRIRDARLQAGMTQTELARTIRTSERNIARWEAGQNQPRIASVALIAEATGHEIDFFLTGSSEADDEDEAAALTLDGYLRLRIRQILREELGEVSAS
jgi:transcriptional regulator with XRE-family HTH domain